MKTWDINDVMTANEWLDIKDDQEYLHGLVEKQRSKTRGSK